MINAQFPLTSAWNCREGRGGVILKLFHISLFAPLKILSQPRAGVPDPSRKWCHALNLSQTCESLAELKIPQISLAPRAVLTCSHRHCTKSPAPLQERCRERGLRREGVLAPPEPWHLAVSAPGVRHKLVCCVIFCVSFLILSTTGALLPAAFEHSWSSGWGFSCRGKISLVQIQSAVPTHLDYCTHHKCWGFCYSHFRVKVFSMCILSLRGSQLRGIDAKACTSPKSHGSLLLQARDQRKPTVNQNW